MSEDAREPLTGSDPGHSTLSSPAPDFVPPANTYMAKIFKPLNLTDPFEGQRHAKKDQIKQENMSESEDSGYHDSDQETDDSVNIDWDEEIEDDDIRYTLAADKAVENILMTRADAINPEYKQFAMILAYSESLKLILIILISAFVIMSRPIWCSKLGSKINWECTRGQDPEHEIDYIKSPLPVISSGTKRIILIVSMAGIMAVDLMKIMVCRGDRTRMYSFYVSLGCLVCYAIGMFLVEFKLMNVTFLDLFALTNVIFGIRMLEKTLLKFLKVLVDAKEILIFFFLFMVTISMVGRLLFFRVDHYYDAEGTTFGFNFMTFQNSFYSLTIANFLQDNFFDAVSGLMEDHKIMVTYWLVVLFFYKFMISNFMCGILYNTYNSLFKKDKLYLRKRKFDRMRKTLKKEIENENLKPRVFKRIMKANQKNDGHTDNFEDVEHFYEKTIRAQKKKLFDNSNQDHMGAMYNRVRHTDSYIIMLGLFEGFTYLLIILAFEMDEEHTYWLLFSIVFLNMILSLDRFMFLLNNSADDSTKWAVLDVLLSLHMMGLGFMCLAISRHDFYVEMMKHNKAMFKWLCLIFVVKSIRFLKLFGYNRQIAVVTKVIFDSFAFLKDILGIIVIFIFLFGSIGCAVFGGNVNTATPAAFEKIYGEEPPEMLMTMNFNDYYYSIVTLFNVMMGGWTDTIKINTAILGENNSMLYNFYFLAFFFFVNLCFLNTLFGFLVDNVSANLDAAIEDAEAEAEEKAESDASSASGSGSDKGSQEGSRGESARLKGDIREEMDSFAGVSGGEKSEEGKEERGGGSGGDVDHEKLSDSYEKGGYDPLAKAVDNVDV